MVIKAIIFDLWETIGTKNVGISVPLREKFGIENTHDYIIKYEIAIQLKKYRSKEELAKSFLDSFNIECTRDNLSFVIDVLQQGIDKATLYDGMYELFEQLSKNYKLGLLSNTTCFESDALKKWSVENFFTAQVYSYQIGTIKPNKKNFKAICSALKVSPEEAIFIDDGQKNITAAINFGLKGIQYKNISQLKKELAILLK